MLEKIEYDDIKKYKRYISFDLNTNSNLYFDKDLIHKIPFIKERDLDKLLKYIDELNLDQIVEIKKIIYYNTFIVGYSMKNYKEYKSLNKFRNRKFELKKLDCLKLVNAVNTLSKHKLLFFDSHLGNILLNPKSNDIKICDIDGLMFKKDENLSTKELKSLLNILLSYLYNVKDCDIENYLNVKEDDKECLFISNCRFTDEEINLEKIIEIINIIKYNYVVKERNDIIKKAKQLSETGYTKFLRY